MDIKAYPPGGIAAGSVSAAPAQRDAAVSENGLPRRFAPVTGHDGSRAPLPPIGPHDFSAARRVHDVVSAGGIPETVRLSLTPHAEAVQYVVRACPSARCATQSWFASRLCGALGLATPTALLVRGCSLAFDGTQAPERLYLATTYLPAYAPLGEWLEGDAAWRVIDGVRGGADDACRQARIESREIGRQMGPLAANTVQARENDRAYATALKRRNERRAVLCRALPDVYQCALERHYIAALWLGNRNLCNASEDNIGVWRDKNDLPCIMTVGFTTCLGPGIGDALADLTPCRQGEYSASFMRRLNGLMSAADGKTVLDELRDPVGVRALAAEMAYRLGRIGAPEILPWAMSAIDVARGLPAQVERESGDGSDASAAYEAGAEDPDSQVHRILSRRDSLVALLGGARAAQAWERLYPMRAAAIKAQQSPFLTPERNACPS